MVQDIHLDHFLLFLPWVQKDQKVQVVHLVQDIQMDLEVQQGRMDLVVQILL